MLFLKIQIDFFTKSMNHFGKLALLGLVTLLLTLIVVRERSLETGRDVCVFGVRGQSEFGAPPP